MYVNLPKYLFIFVILGFFWGFYALLGFEIVCVTILGLLVAMKMTEM